jgi:arginyl-tRNA synthetase
MIVHAMIKDYLAQKIARITARNEDWPSLDPEDIQLERPKKDFFGDLTSNVAMVLAKEVGQDPLAIAEQIAGQLRLNRQMVKSWTVCAPGFINFIYGSHYLRKQLVEIHAAGRKYGTSDLGRGQKVQVEFVSANPTGPLNVVNARAAAVGDSIANLLQASGYHVEREYYVNDTGAQVNRLAESVHIRYRQLLGEDVDLPEDAYHGEYLIDLARELIDEVGMSYRSMSPAEVREKIRHWALRKLVTVQREDLERFRVVYDVWMSERSLKKSGALEEILALFTEKGFLYERGGAVWFRSSDFDDAEDRVLIKEDGSSTYFLMDIAYHKNKFDRGFERVIDLWGPDHHGYLPRMRSAAQALGIDPANLELHIIQQVNLLRGGKPVKMSKREGSIVTMRELLNEVGTDVARFFFLMRRMESHLDFDMDKAVEQSEENPVYYVQYAHARISSILNHAREQNVELQAPDQVNLSLLKNPEEIDLIKKISLLPEVIQGAARALEPHRITTYLREVATSFHQFYHKRRVLTQSSALTAARLTLIEATRIVLHNALNVIGVKAPTHM